MKSLKQVLAESVPTFFRFQVFTMDHQKKDKTIGMAYIREGQSIYTLRLWMFLEDRFYLLPKKEDPTKFLLMTREERRSDASTNKYFWNVVGNASADQGRGLIKLNFDLFEKSIFMSLYPDESSNPFGKLPPEEELAAA